MLRILIVYACSTYFSMQWIPVEGEQRSDEISTRIFIDNTNYRPSKFVFRLVKLFCVTLIIQLIIYGITNNQGSHVAVLDFLEVLAF